MRPTAPTSQPREVRLSVIAPCFNEEANVALLARRTLAAFDALAAPAELILVDDGSADRTWTRIEEAHERDARAAGVRHAQNRGIEAAWRSGLTVASGELVCLIDADLQNRPEDVCILYDYFQRGSCDIVQAVRHPARNGERCHAFTRGLNLLLNVTFGTRLRDNKSGFLLCRRAALSSILAHRFRYRYFQCFVGVAARTRGLTIGEVDTAFDLRHGGKSFLSQRPVGVSLRVLWELVKFRAESSLFKAPAPSATHPCPNVLVADA